MGAAQEVKRVVFDTTTVVSALAFTHGQLAWLRRHWRDRECIPMASRETTEELLRVLGYRKFGITTERRNELLADYLPYCEIVDVREPCPVKCRDAKDQPFLDLAHAGKAEALVSGDRDLLVLAGKTVFSIEMPAAYRLRVTGA